MNPNEVQPNEIIPHLVNRIADLEFQLAAAHALIARLQPSEVPAPDGK